jgi:hypothetical protein
MGPFGDDPLQEILRIITQSPRNARGISGISDRLPQLPGLLPNQRGAAPRGSIGRGAAGAMNPGMRLGASIGNILTGGGQQQQQQDPLTSMYEQLLQQLQQPVNMPQAVDTEDLMRQIQSAINPIYDQRANSARGQDTRNRQEVEDMYRALASDYERLAPQQAQQAKANQADIQQIYGQLRSNIEGDYSRVAAQQADEFAQLGITDALPEVMAEQQAPVQQALTSAAENQAQQEQRYMDIGAMDQTYFREGSPNATMRGNEIQTDMLAQLTDYLNQIEAERTAAIQSGYSDQLNQANSLLSQQQNNAQQQANRNQEMLWQMLQAQMQGGKQTALTPDTFMSGLPPEQQQSVASAFTRLQRSPEAIYGKVEDKRNPVPGTFVETTPQWYMAQADEMLRRGEIDPVTHQALLMYMQLNFKV